MQASFVAHRPFVAAAAPQRYRSDASVSLKRRAGQQIVRAQPFNEGAAQVRRLVDRDR